jgi:hypothetical protein
LLKAYYMRTRNVQDWWIYTEVGLTWLSVAFQLAYWPVYLLVNSEAAFKILAWSSIKVFRVCIYLRRMREILSSLVMSYKVRFFLR